jgi:hypothetical protein
MQQNGCAATWAKSACYDVFGFAAQVDCMLLVLAKAGRNALPSQVRKS